MKILRATTDHALGIASVHIRSWQSAYKGILEQAFLDGLSIDARAKRWQDILQKQESVTLIAERNHVIVGFVSYGPCRDEGAPAEQGEIWALYADPDSWGQGVGFALMTRAAQELSASGYVTVSLWVLSRNHRGLDFYQRFGFSLVESSQKVFELGGSQVEEVCLLLPNQAIPG
jgi:ribosomal protein S18 acetylase RimI-like enzyme